MAITLDAATLAEAIGAENHPATAARLLTVASRVVNDYTPDTPDEVANEAVIRLAGYWFGSDFGGIRSETLGPMSVSYASNHAAAFRFSGAAGLLTRYRKRRAGSIDRPPTPTPIPEPVPTPEPALSNRWYLTVIRTDRAVTADDLTGPAATYSDTASMIGPVWTGGRYVGFGYPAAWAFVELIYAGTENARSEFVRRFSNQTVNGIDLRVFRTGLVSAAAYSARIWTRI